MRAWQHVCRWCITNSALLQAIADQTALRAAPTSQSDRRSDSPLHPASDPAVILPWRTKARVASDPAESQHTALARDVCRQHEPRGDVAVCLHLRRREIVIPLWQTLRIAQPRLRGIAEPTLRVRIKAFTIFWKLLNTGSYGPVVHSTRGVDSDETISSSSAGCMSVS